MAFPAALKVFWEFTAGVWTDVTSDVDTSQQVSIHYGRTKPGDTPSAASLSFRLANPLGKYTPFRQVLADGTTANTYYPNVTIRKRVKVSYTISAVEYPQFVGYITSIVPGMVNGVWDYADIQATCLMDQLSRIDLQEAVLRELMQDTPAYLWPMTDPSGSTSALETSGNNGPALTTDTTAPTFGSTGPGSNAGVQFATGQTLSAVVSETGTSTWECFFNLTALPTNLLNLMSIGGSINIDIDNTGLIQALVGHTASVSVTSWHHVALTLDGAGNGSFYFDGSLVANETGFSSSGSGLAVGDVFGLALGGLPVNMGFVGVYSTQLSATRIAAHAAAGLGYYGDTTGGRVARVLGWAGLTSSSWTLDTGKAIVGTYPQEGKSVLQYCQDMAVTEGGGAVFYTTPDGKARFADRTYRKAAAPVATFDATDDLTNRYYTPSVDQFTLINQVTVSRSAASGTLSTQTAVNAASAAPVSSGGNGLSASSITSYTSTDLDALENAQQIVAANAQPGFRFPKIGVSLLTAKNALYVAVAGVQIGSRIRVSNIPTGVAPATQVDLIVEGWTVTFGSDMYDWVADTSPADNPPEGIWDDTSYGRFQCSGQTLNSTITSSGTTVVIATSGSNPTFTTTSARYPMSIQIGEEVITLNNPPGGSSSPQTFTGVSRGQKGTPAAAQTSGSTIYLWPAVTWAL